MKKLLLLFLISILPFSVLGQTDMVKWVNSNFSPTTQITNISANSISVNGGVQLVQNDYGSTDTFFQTSGWGSQSQINTNKYIQFTIKANNGFIVKPTTFSFKARNQGGTSKIVVRYSNNANFSGFGTFSNVAQTSANYVNYSLNFPANYASAVGSSIYVRIYIYETNNNFHISYDTGANEGPTFSGTLSSSTVLAVNDAETVANDEVSNINVLANDYPGNGTFTNVSNLSTPTNNAGVVSVNADKTIKFTPTSGFIGTTLFNYTVTNSAGGTSQAQVTLTVTDPVLAEWALTNATTTAVTFQQTYVSANAVLLTGTAPSYSSAGMALAYFTNTDFAHFRFFDIKIKPTTGSIVNVKNLAFEQARLISGNQSGASDYQIKYKIVTGTFNEADDSFFNTATVLVTNESIANNPMISIPLNLTLNSTQSLVVRFYAKGANNYNYAGWRIKANSLKIRGNQGCSSTSPMAAPTSVTGNNSICSGSSTTLTANGATGTFEWGTGAVGNNILPNQTSNAITVSPTTGTTYWVRVKANTPCKTDSSGKTFTVNVTNPPVAPTSITGNNTICSGASTTLTANGSSGTYEWGTGTTIGTTILANQTSNSITVSPTTTTTYWVRVKATSPCTTPSAGITYTVSVSSPATAPTTISGDNTSNCPGSSISLTANGGSGATFQWGTGTVGTNIITNATNATITVTPNTSTTYWVRRVNTTPCTGFTSAITKTITVLPIPGDPSVFGNNEWNVYAFNSGGNANPSDYRGFYTQNLGTNIGIDTKLKWADNTSPSSASNWTGCTVNNNNFTIVHKRQGFPCGRYKLDFLYYDDDTVITIKDAEGVIWTNTFTGFYNGGAGLSQAINGTNTFALNENATIEIRTTDIGGGPSKLGIIFTATTNAVFANGNWVNGVNPSYTDINVQDHLNLPTDLTVCSCTVTSGNTLTVPADKTLIVIGNATAQGTGKFIIENNGSFVQVNDNSIYSGEPASFIAKRDTQPVYRFDVTYWSSPVENFVLKHLSPVTLFDKFFSFDSNTQAWVVHKSNLSPNLLEVMTPGKGYNVRAPQNFSIQGTTGAQPQIHTAQFVGKPNNGVKQITVANGAPNKYNLIGNPYPSALSISEFLKVNKDVVDGTLYFWSHQSIIQNSPNPNYITYSATDYVAINLSGNVSNGTDSNSDNDFMNVASGQSFFIRGKVSGVTSNQVTFNNAMRVKTGGNNNQFFKPGVSTPVDNWQNTGKHRIWLNMTSEQKDFNQTLVGYIQEATNGLDWGYDGEMFSSGALTFYSLLNEKSLTIQGRALPFSTQDEIPLGYTTTRTGTMSISIDKVDGLFQGQDVFLEDKVLNVVHNLKNATYSFTTLPGTFNDRFVLRYLPEENLGTEMPVIDANAIVIYNANNQISVKTTDVTLGDLYIYDLQGRLIFSKNNINTQEFTTTALNTNNQVVLVKIITDTKAELVKKVMLK